MGQYAIERGNVRESHNLGQTTVIQNSQKSFSHHEKKIIDNRPKFDRLTDKEWQDATESVKQLVKWRLNGSKQCSGAHSESTLGMPAVDYYVGEAI